MAYTDRNFKNGKALKEAFATGEPIGVQPGPFGPSVNDGVTCIEGPHYPAPHSFYVTVTVGSGIITRIDGKDAHYWRAKLAKASEKAAEKAAKYDTEGLAVKLSPKALEREWFGDKTPRKRARTDHTWARCQFRDLCPISPEEHMTRGPRGYKGLMQRNP